MKRHIQIAEGKHVHVYGWKRDRPDHRDQRFKVRRTVYLPPKGDVTEYCSRIEDQGQIGSCTANSSTSALEYLYRKEGHAQPELSRLFVYWWTRHNEGTQPGDDSGCQIRDVLTTLATVGCCKEDTWAYDPARYADQPPDAATQEAAVHKILTYRRCDDLEAIKQAIAEGFPVIGGFSVPENMESQQCATTGIVEYPRPQEQIVGGHAVLFVGYDDATQMVKFANSWGPGWGDHGFGYLSYRFFTDGLADDFWVVLSEQEYVP